VRDEELLGVALLEGVGVREGEDVSDVVEVTLDDCEDVGLSVPEIVAVEEVDGELVGLEVAS
jgi:hypothetical protein